MAKEELQRAIADLGLTVESEFIPWSKSRNAKPQPKLSDRSLNWRVTLKRDGRDVLTTDYSAGIAHCPSYHQGARETLDYAEAIAQETEHGRRYSRGFGATGKPIMPDAVDVVASLVMDSDVLDASSFEEWASDLGYDPDSRKAEGIYRTCLELALKLRNALGEDGLTNLREAAQDY